MAAKGVSILLVEDEPDVAEMLPSCLGQSGGLDPDVRCAATLAEALAAMRQDSPDVVLLDLMLPDSKGLQTLIDVRQAAGDIPVIVMTSVSDEQMALEALREGAEDYLFKSNLAAELLVRTVRYALERHRRRRAERRLDATTGEMKLARSIQQALYPQAVPLLPQCQMAGWAFPAESVGGDYFDFFPLTDGSQMIAIGDATGHGIGPALVMAQTRACLRALATSTRSLPDMLARANEVLSKGMLESLYITLLLVRLDPSGLMLEYTSAGHPPGYVFGTDGRIRQRLDSTCSPLGLADTQLNPDTQRVRLHHGDLLLLVTDGVPEAGIDHDRPFGTDGILRVVRGHVDASADQMVRILIQAVRTHCLPNAIGDDATAVAVRISRRAELTRRGGRHTPAVPHA